MRIRSLPLIFVAALAAGSAQAEGEGRYRMEKTETGFIRLDTLSGDVSLCREQDGQIVCRMAADERAAFEKELDLLTKRVEALEKGGATALTDAKPALPTDEEIDRTMTIMEKMMQRFMGIVKNLEDGEEETAPGKDAIPQKT
jgi:exonuclease VII small subunit